MERNNDIFKVIFAKSVNLEDFCFNDLHQRLYVHHFLGRFDLYKKLMNMDAHDPIVTYLRKLPDHFLQHRLGQLLVVWSLDDAEQFLQSQVLERSEVGVWVLDDT